MKQQKYNNYEDQHSLEAKWRRPKRQVGLPAKLTDYILEWPKTGHLGTKADAQAAHTRTKAETKAAGRVYAATSRPATACHRLQFNRACILHGDARKQHSVAESVRAQQQVHTKRAVVNNTSFDICTSKRAHRMAKTKHTER